MWIACRLPLRVIGERTKELNTTRIPADKRTRLAIISSVCCVRAQMAQPFRLFDKSNEKWIARE